VPELRRWLLKVWHEGGALDQVFVNIANNGGALSDGYWIRRTLASAVLWWIEPETCDVLAASAPTLPQDYRFDMADMPSPAGFAVFAHDLWGIDSNPPPGSDGMCRVSALLWGPVTVPIGEGQRLEDALGMGTFSRSVLQDGLDKDEMYRAGPTLGVLGMEYQDHRDPYSTMLNGDLYTYLGRSDWLPGLTADDVAPGDPYHTPEAIASKAEDRKLIAGMWALARTPMARVIEHHPPRAVARRSQRDGYSSSIQVLTLNRSAVETSGTMEMTENSVTVDWQHSWIVRPHWRWQAHGPGHTQRRLQLIQAYRKGPADKPLLGADRVWRVKPPARKEDQ
jgi:hypothetical protein